MKFERSSGILLHPTALPGPEGLGTLGQGAWRFVDFLAAAGQRLWQVCPLGPTGFGNSPYQCFSAFAGNPLLIDLELLREAGWLNPPAPTELSAKAFDRVDFEAVIATKWPLLERAWIGFCERASAVARAAFDAFCAKRAAWLDDYALFMALKDCFGQQAWDRWDAPARDREPGALECYRQQLSDTIRFHKFSQYVFFQQWMSLKEYAHTKGVQIIGDIPIFVAFDSADVWAHRELFQFDHVGKPVAVAGVPPDYFSATGQLWGNPLYDWEHHRSTGYAWWIEVIRSKLNMYDMFRVDHFRGFAAYWRIPYGEETAVNGSWVAGPGPGLFQAVEQALGELPIIAEDLGVITDDVVQLRERFGFPGMKILQFAFDSAEENEFRPFTWPSHCVAYTGTHDNDTVRGWLRSARPHDRAYAEEYLHADGQDLVWAFIRTVWASTAVIAMAPMQDILGLGSESRFNIPGTLGGNWEWRLDEAQLSSELADRLNRLSAIYVRSGDLLKHPEDSVASAAASAALKSPR